MWTVISYGPVLLVPLQWSIRDVVMVDLNLFSERFCNKSRPHQSKDQRIQHDKVGRAVLSSALFSDSVHHFSAGITFVSFYLHMYFDLQCTQQQV